MSIDAQPPRRLRHLLFAALGAFAAWLACPATAFGSAAFSSLTLSTQICATSELQQLAPHLAALVALLVLVAISLRGDVEVCIEYFPIRQALRKTFRLAHQRRERQ